MDPYSRLWIVMRQFHDRFRRQFLSIYEQAGQLPSVTAKENADIRRFCRGAYQLYEQLDGHHSIEEEYIFPALGKKMDVFKKGEGAHLQQHRQIHEGLDTYVDYLKACLRDQSKFDSGKLRGNMDSWRMVLFQHLDEEVDSLHPDNMKKYWTREEAERFMI